MRRRRTWQLVRLLKVINDWTEFELTLDNTKFHLKAYVVNVYLVQEIRFLLNIDLGRLIDLGNNGVQLVKPVVQHHTVKLTKSVEKSDESRTPTLEKGIASS